MTKAELLAKSKKGEAVLKHYGVLGMKWGRRKGDYSTSKQSADYKKAASLKGKKLSEMSNDELKTLNNRMQLEKQYKDLKSNSKGESEAKKFMKNFGKQQLNIVGGMAVAFVVKQAINYTKSKYGIG